MPHIDFKTSEEIALYDKMKQALSQHNSRSVRNKYYPNNMDVWKNEKDKIESVYRAKIANIQNKRVSFEKEEKYHDDEIAAAKALLQMKIINERREEKAFREKRTSKRVSKHITVSKTKDVNTPFVRRSSRIANKNN